MLEQPHQIASEPVVITIPEKDRKSNTSFGLALRQRFRRTDGWAEKPVKDGWKDGWIHTHIYMDIIMSTYE